MIAEMPVWWPSNISVGMLFFLLGVVGAAITVYFGEWEKLIGKSALMLEIDDEIEAKRKIAEIIKDPREVELREKWEGLIARDQNRLDKERQFVRIQGTVLYLIIGGVFAAILANTVLEAVAFGAGWTGLIGVFGIKKDSEERRKIRDQKDEESLERLSKLQDELTVKIREAYKKGRSDGAEEVVDKLARVENVTVVELIDKLRKV
jgi:hypothetical protein